MNCHTEFIKKIYTFWNSWSKIKVFMLQSLHFIIEVIGMMMKFGKQGQTQDNQKKEKKEYIKKCSIYTMEYYLALNNKTDTT